MSMNKKDYQAIAGALYELRDILPEYTQHVDTPRGYGFRDCCHVPEKTTTAHMVAEALARVFKYDNPDFDRARFLEACETGTTKGMRK